MLMVEEQPAAVWQWQFTSPRALQRSLEEYTEYFMAQGAPPAGGDVDPTKRDRAYRIYCQNQEIDRGMRDILWTNRSAWRMLNLYYRQGFCTERRGWIAPARAIGIPVPVCFGGDTRCQVPGDDRLALKLCDRGRECTHYRRQFEERLMGAILALFAAIEARYGRTVDAGTGHVLD